ncbi:hypothetical protein GCM10011487_69780 [Steroidobacter agaridevorans]|uniref:Uncharacterized protein n=1 Tax=Steroidobacter agaridevorans TaxID=2695856 RepID=A0A829YQY6_9GAMM|nr:hypothetical protein GCM10011487_69780 [Steroidobacter agaridevorans]
MRTLKSRHSILEALGAVAIGLLIAHILSALLLDVGTWAPPLTVAASWACATIGLTHQLSMPLHRTALRSSLVAITIGVILIFILCHLHDIHELWAALSDFRVSPVDAGNESRSEASIGDTNMGTAFLACLIGATLWLPLNMIIPPQDALSWLHRSEQTNELDAFLYSAAAKQLLVLLSLADGKFYVGYIQQLSKNPTAQSSWVRILPVVSGYRTDVSKELNFTTFYQDVYEDLSKKSDFNEESLLSFTKILPIANITSANPFDPNIYMLFARETLDHQATDDEKSADNGEPAPRQIDARVDQATNTTR